jgi:hypothetical protein
MSYDFLEHHGHVVPALFGISIFASIAIRLAGGSTTGDLGIRLRDIYGMAFAGGLSVTLCGVVANLLPAPWPLRAGAAVALWLGTLLFVLPMVVRRSKR